MMTFLLGAYLSGAAFTYWISKSGFDMDRAPEWQKIIAALGIALVWPIPAAIWGVMILKETIF